MAGYSYITLAQLRAQLMTRLQDTSNTFVSVTEANSYLFEALRILNALTYTPGQVDYLFNFNPGDSWKTLNVPGSPRQRTITDTYIYTQIESMLLEPATGGVWTGTNQYNISLLSSALQFRRDELLLESAAFVQNLLIPSPVAAVRTTLPDSTLDLRRVRWIVSAPDSTAYALSREDILSRNAFGVLLPTQPGQPDSWMITANSPLAFDVSCPPNQPGTWDTLVSYAGPAFTPPASIPLGLPNDWTWVAQYGALADILSNAPEGRDSIRAKYCLSRYEQGKKAMLKLPWLLQATVASIPVDTPSYLEMDSFAQNWENNWPDDDPMIVIGGIDFIALAPFIDPPEPIVSTVLTVVGNAPIPATDTSFVQVDRDGVDQILNYAQHIATFKRGGRDFEATFPLLAEFESYCRNKNAQYAALGIYRPEMLHEGTRIEDIDPRFEHENEPPPKGVKNASKG